MRLVIYITSLLFASSVAAQFTQVEDKGKVGFQYGIELIKKPKYDSIIIGDKTIVTAYKKEKVYYITKSGKVIHKGKLAQTSPFINGTGNLKNKKDQHAIIMANGDYLMDYLYTEKPIKYGQMIYVKNAYRNNLFNASVLLENGIDSVTAVGAWLISYTSKEGGGQHHLTSKLYHADKGTLIMDDISSYEIYDNNLLVYQGKILKAIYTLNGNSGMKDIEEFVIIDSSQFSAIHNDKRGIYSFNDLRPIITGNYNSFILKSNSIYALGNTTREFPDLDIYDYQGKLLITNIQYVSDLAENRSVFAIGWLQYIGTEYGEQLCAFYLGFGKEQNGYRIAYKAHSYRYVNDQTYAIIGREYPVIGRKKSTYGGSSNERKGLIRTLVEGIANTTRRFNIESPVNSFSSIEYDPKTINIVEAGTGFQDGFAIICLYGLKADFNYTSLTLTEDFVSLKYNYIDTTGQLLDKKKYDECRPFNKGYAWVKEGDYYYLINEIGERQNKYRYKGVRKDDNGYYIVRYRGEYGIINADYELVVPCEHSMITFEDGKYIETYFTEKTVIYELPISKLD